MGEVMLGVIVMKFDTFGGTRWKNPNIMGSLERFPVP